MDFDRRESSDRLARNIFWLTLLYVAAVIIPILIFIILR